MWSPVTPFWFLLTALAVWRLVVFVRQDGLIEGSRNKLIIFFGQKQKLWADKANYLLGCQWCLGIWFGLLAAIGWQIKESFDVLEFLVVWFALAATSSIVDLITDNL